MNELLTDQYLNKTVAVVGLGISNQAAIRFFIQRGAKVEVFDRKPEEELDPTVRRQLFFWDVDYHGGDSYLSMLAERKFDFICPTPGMRKDLPELLRAMEQGAELTSEIGLFFDHCPCTIVGVTGSAGKTTTTTLLSEMLKQHLGEGKVWTGGNIGWSLLEYIEHMREDHIALLELSSFQLQMLRRSPHIALLLNIQPNHLDVHSSMEEYIESKKNIFRFQSPGDLTILSADDPLTRQSMADVPGRCLRFSLASIVPDGACLRDDMLLLHGAPLMPVQRVGLTGAHNLYNVMAASLAAKELGVPNDVIAAIAASFKGVEHRLEVVAEVNGVTYVNDSIATSPDRTMAALQSFDRPIILLAGGYDKRLDYSAMGELTARKVRLLVLYGQTADKIEAATRLHDKDGKCTVLRVQNLQEACEAAQRHSQSGDVVLLSPASASYDQFPNYQERGRAFKQWVIRQTGNGM